MIQKWGENFSNSDGIFHVWEIMFAALLIKISQVFDNSALDTLWQSLCKLKNVENFHQLKINSCIFRGGLRLINVPCVIFFHFIFPMKISRILLWPIIFINDF